MPVINFAQVKDPELLPRANYLARVSSAEEGLSNSQQPKIDLIWEILAPESHAGRKVFQNLPFHPDAQSRTKKILIGMGIPEDFDGEVVADDLVGKECCITVDIENSKKTDPETGDPYPDRNKVRRVRPASAYKPGEAVNEALAGLQLS